MKAIICSVLLGFSMMAYAVDEGSINVSAKDVAVAKLFGR